MSFATADKQIKERLIFWMILQMVCAVLGGQSWMVFIGNEFGHPDWVELPNESNNQSHFYARRQWWLADDPNLLFHDLNNFSKGLNLFLAAYNEELQKENLTLESTKRMVVKKGDLIVAFSVSGEPIEESWGNIIFEVPFGGFESKKAPPQIWGGIFTH